MHDLLYHYTSEPGLIGIVENDNLRATHVRFLNDWTEFREAFAEDYVRQLLDSFRASLPEDLPPDAITVIDGIISRRAPEILEIISGSDSANETFVCSFTSSLPQEAGDPGDRLSQWRGYASAGQGFSLGFDKTLLKNCVEINNPKAKASLEECIYNDAEKTAFFENMGRAAASRFNDLKQSNAQVPSTFVTVRPDASGEYKRSAYYFLDSLSRATAAFFTTAARIKHVGFQEEHEWRVIFQAKKDALAPVEKGGKRIEIVKFRDGQFGRTPYIDIPLGLADAQTSPLRRIVVGPGRHKEDVKRFVELFLLNRGIQGIEVSTSIIPYRSS